MILAFLSLYALVVYLVGMAAFAAGGPTAFSKRCFSSSLIAMMLVCAITLVERA